MADKDFDNMPAAEEPRPIVLKGIPLSAQAERLVRVRREIIRVEELTRAEQIELEARQKADLLLSEARMKADEIVESARKAADGIREEARKHGEGEAKREALERLAGLIAAMEEEIALLRSARADFLRENLAGIVEFACELARRILAIELRTDPETVARRVCALLERMPPAATVTLCVSPEDIDTIERYLQDGGGPAQRILPSLRSDPTMKPGSARLESDSGLLNASIFEKLEELGRLLVDQARYHSMSGTEGGMPSGI